MSNLDFQNQEHVLQFLTGLNEFFYPVPAQVLLIDPFPSLSNVFSMIIQEERQRKLGFSHHSRFVAATTFAHNPNSQTRKMRPTCSHRKKQGHLKDKCYFLHGFPLVMEAIRPPMTTPPTLGKNLQNHPLLSTHFKPQTLQVSTTSNDTKSLSTHFQKLIARLSQQLQKEAAPSTFEQPPTTNFLGTSPILKIGITRKLGNLYYLQQEAFFFFFHNTVATPISCNTHCNKTLWHTRL
ncbi:uncharacterized protein LOC133777958 [Humulus lupulus]|uniref:uncharacterized protein LOC133777958 n=1 Tax=Humulus lupulus TaxID=3486 RepID=UPI002B41645C|nr:uncharacterized protein LOC133777958 [Humulus lupulus]